MKKQLVFLLIALISSTALFSQAQNDIRARRVIANEQILLRNTRIDSILNDTTGIAGKTKSILTAKAVYDLVLGRSGGGGGTPAGSTKQFQYNNAGAFAGSGMLTQETDQILITGTGSTIPFKVDGHEDLTDEIVNVSQSGVKKFSMHSNGAIEMQDVSAPGTPASGYGSVYVRTDSLRFKNDAGIEFTLGACVANSDIDTLNLINFHIGQGRSYDTSYMTTDYIGNYYHDGSDTLVVTKIKTVASGTSPSLTANAYYNTSFGTGGNPLLTSDITTTSTTEGNSSTIFSNYKIPPGNWIWSKINSVSTKPTMLTMSLIGYRKPVTYWPAISCADSDAENYFARVEAKGGYISNENKTRIKYAILEMKADGIWSKLNEIWISNLTGSFAGSNCKLKYTSIDSVTYVNITSSDWNTTDGVVLPLSNSTKYVNTNYNTSGLTADNVQAGLWLTDKAETGTSDITPFGNVSGSNAIAIQLRNSSGYIDRVFCGSTSTYATYTGNKFKENIYGLFSSSATSLSAVQDYEKLDSNLVSRGTGALPNLSIYLGALNNGGTPIAHSDGNLKGYFLGTSLNYQEYTNVVAGVFGAANYRDYNIDTNWVYMSFDATSEKMTAYKGSLSKMNQKITVNNQYKGYSSTLSQRDASVIRVDSFYYLVHSSVPYGNFYAGNRTFTLIKSRDLQRWELVDTINVTSSTTNLVWSPRWFVDNGNYYVIFNYDSTTTGSNFRPYYVQITDLNTGSHTSKTEITGSSVVANGIDYNIVKKGSTYYLTYKNESTSYLGRLSSSSPFSGYNTYTDLSSLGSGIEGTQYVFDGSTWYFFYDKYAALTGMHYRTSTDDWATWSSETQLGVGTDAIRNGNIINPNVYTRDCRND